MNLYTIQKDLGANCKDDEEVLENIYKEVISLASSFSNQKNSKSHIFEQRCGRNSIKN